MFFAIPLTTCIIKITGYDVNRIIWGFVIHIPLCILRVLISLIYHHPLTSSILFHKQINHTLSLLSNFETTITVLLKFGSMSLIASNHNDEHHSTLLCWRNKRIRWGGLANDFTIERISSGVFSGSPFLAWNKNFTPIRNNYITKNSWTFNSSWS